MKIVINFEPAQHGFVETNLDEFKDEDFVGYRLFGLAKQGDVMIVAAIKGSVEPHKFLAVNQENIIDFVSCWLDLKNGVERNIVTVPHGE